MTHSDTHAPATISLSTHTYASSLLLTHHLSLLLTLSPPFSHTWLAYCGRISSNVGNPTAVRNIIIQTVHPTYLQTDIRNSKGQVYI